MINNGPQVLILTTGLSPNHSGPESLHQHTGTDRILGTYSGACFLLDIRCYAIPAGATGCGSPRFTLTQNLAVTAQVGWRHCQPGSPPLDDRKLDEELPPDEGRQDQAAERRTIHLPTYHVLFSCRRVIHRPPPKNEMVYRRCLSGIPEFT